MVVGKTHGGVIPRPVDGARCGFILRTQLCRVRIRQVQIIVARSASRMERRAQV